MEPELWFGWFRPDILVEYRELFWRGALMTLGMTVVCVLLGGTWGCCWRWPDWPRHATHRGIGCAAFCCAGPQRCM